MAQEIINYGAAPNDGSGDPLRTAFVKTDNNFDQIWAAGPVGSNVTILNNTIAVTNVNGNLTLSPNGVGVIKTSNDVLPTVDRVYDLGSPTLRYRTLYANTANLLTLTVGSDLSVQGNLIVSGNIIQMGNIVTDSLTIQLANTATSPNLANGAGITVGANDDIATLLYDAGNNVWTTNIGIQVGGPITGTSLAVSSATIYGNVNAVNGNFTGNVTANYFIGDGSQLTNINPNSIDFGNLTANINTTGNVAANYFIGNGSQLTDIDANNINGLATVAYTGDYNDLINTPNFGNLTGNLTTTGNITGNYIFGNGSQLVGVTNYANANAVAYGEAGWSGNIIPTGNGVYTLGNSTNQWESLYVSNTTIYINNVPIGLTAGNVLTVGGEPILSNDSNTSITTTGNITADYFLGNGSQLTGLNTNSISNGNSNVQIATLDGNVTVTTNGANTWTFDTDGNLSLPAGGSLYSEGFTPSGAPGNTIILNPHGSGSITNQKLMIYPTAGDGDHIHLVTGNLYQTELFVGSDNFYVKLESTGNVVVLANDDQGNSAVWSFGNDGVLTVPGNIVMPGGASLIGDGGSPAPSISGFDSISAVSLTASGNVSGNYILGNAAFMTGIPAQYGNANVATFLANFGSNTISTTGNITGNLVAPGANRQVMYNDNGVINGSTAFTFDENGNTLSIGTTSGTLKVADIQTPQAGVSLRLIPASGITYSYGNLLPLFANTYDTGGASNRWQTIFANVANLTTAAVSGAVTASTITLSSTGTAVNASQGNMLTNQVTGTQFNFLNGAYTASINGGGATANYTLSLPANAGSAGQTLTTDGAGILSWSTPASTYGNANVATFLASFGSNTISTTGNISSGYILGNGSQLTGVANASFTTVSANGTNVVADSATDTVTFTPGNNMIITGNASTDTVTFAISEAPTFSGNVTAQNFVGNISVTGNVTGTSSNVTLIAGSYSWTFNNTGNLVLPGNTFTVNYANGTAVSLGGNYGDSNVVTLMSAFGSNTIVTTGNITGGNLRTTGATTTGVNALLAGPTFTPLANTSAGFVANVNSYSQITFQNKNTGADATADYILTSDNGSDTVNYGDFGIINSGYDNLTPTNSLGNIVYAADTYIYAQGNASNTAQSGGNLVIGVTVPTKTVKIFAGGANNNSLIANISNTGLAVAGAISATGNVTANNFVGNVSLTGNIQGTSANVELVAGSYTWTFNNTGNLILPGNTFSVNYANGTAVSLGGAGSYGDSNVVTLLSTFGSNTIVTTGNVSVGNISATNLGNVSALNLSANASTVLYGNGVFAALPSVGTVPVTFVSANTTVSKNSVIQITNTAPANVQLTLPVGSGLSTGDSIVFYPYNSVGTFQTYTIKTATDGIQGLSSVGGTYYITGSIPVTLNWGGAFWYFSQTTTGGGSSYGDSNVATLLNSFGSNNISTTGNITAGYLLGNGSQLTGVANLSFSTVVANGNGIIADSSADTLTFTSGNNLVITGTSGTDTVTFAVSDSPTFSGNVTATYLFGNISQATGGYGNSNVVALMANFGSNTIVTTGNITGGNITVPGASTTGINAVTVGVNNVILPNTIASFSSNVNGYTQLTLENINSGADATADFILTADNGSDTVNYGDFGIINSGYDVNTPTNSLGNIVYAGDTYIYAQGNVGNTNQSGGNLVLGATVTSKNIKLFAGGSNTNALVATISNAGITMNSGNITGNTNGFAIGYRDIPQVTFAANTTISTSDAGKHYYSTSASNLTLTIANNASQAFAIGAAINLVNLGTGNITIAQGSGVTMYFAGNSTAGNRTVAGYGAATMQKVATDTWFLVGVGIT